MQKKQIVYEVLLFAYLVFLVWAILFKMNLSLADIYPVQEVNLIPFYYDVSKTGDMPVYEFILNVLAFAPFGFLLAKAFRNLSLINGVAISFLLSLLFEVLQYILLVGVSDVTDLIMNTLGGGIGFWLATVFTRET